MCMQGSAVRHSIDTVERYHGLACHQQNDIVQECIIQELISVDGRCNRSR